MSRFYTYFFLCLFSMFAVGAHAEPELAWQDSEGTTHQWSGLAKGKPSIVHFWASWCPPCRGELPALVAWSKQHEDIQLIAISLDENIDNASRFIQQKGLDLAVLQSHSAQVRDWGIRALPTSYLINAEGQVVQRYVGAVDWSNANFSQTVLTHLKGQ